tara:strand:- start:1349 stop:1675 length:327 start_codon:yes stop_codon:yes gene_type:complete
MTTKTKIEKPFSTLVGKRVVLPFPQSDEKTESGIILTEAAQNEKLESEIADMTKMPVIQTGNECDYIKEGMEVYVQPGDLVPGRCEVLKIDGKIKYFIVPERAVVGIY